VSAREEYAGTYQDLCAREAWPFAAAEHSWAGNSAASWAGARLCEWQRRWKGDVCDEDARVEMDGRRKLSGDASRGWSLDVIRASYMAGLQAGNPTKLPSSGKIIISRRLVLPGTVLSLLSRYEIPSQVILLPLQARYIHVLDA
jgi:hypothetical protein